MPDSRPGFRKWTSNRLKSIKTKNNVQASTPSPTLLTALSAPTIAVAASLSPTNQQIVSESSSNHNLPLHVQTPCISGQEGIVPAGPLGTQLVKSPSNPRYSLVREVLQRFSEEDQKLVGDYGIETFEDFGNTCSDLINACKEKREAFKDARWAITIKGEPMFIRNKVDKIVDWISKIQKIGDLAISVDPIHVGLPWAGIRLLLQAVTADSQQMTALICGVEEALRVVTQCKVYTSIYINNEERSDAFMLLRNAVGKLYIQVLQFLIKAIRLFVMGSGERAARAFWNLDDVVAFGIKCKELEAKVETAANLCEQYINRATYLQKMLILQEIMQEAKDTKHSLASMDYKVASIWESLEKERQSRILTWASQIPCEDIHDFTRKARTEDTGEWLLNDDRYKSWKDGQSSQILWLHGIPGAGKTKLVSKVIDSLINGAASRGFAYFYCSRNEHKQRQVREVLASFVKQLSISPDRLAVSTLLVKLYEKKEQTGMLSNIITTEECEMLIKNLSETYYTQVFLIMDAMDECEEDQRTQLLAVFNRFIEDIPSVKIFVSSRRDNDIKIKLSKRANIGVEAINNTQDIEKFVMESITQNRQVRQDREWKPISEELNSEITRTLLEKSQGMFQWVSLQITHLLSLERQGFIRQRLTSLPDDLKAAYDEILNDIHTTNDGLNQIADRTFQWLICAQDISTQALVEAACQDPESDGLQEVDINIDSVLRACRNLVVLDETQGKFQFAHLSVREYLEKHHWSFHVANTLATTVCLMMLNGLGNHTNVIDREPIPIDGLFNYSARHWIFHIREHERLTVDKRIITLLKQFLGNPDGNTPAYENWYNYMYDGGYYFYIYLLRPCTVTKFALCYFGFEQILSDWWNEWSSSANATNARGESLLAIAAFVNYPSIVKRLISLGADVNMRLEGDYGSALAAAAYGRSEECLQILLNAGAEVNMRLEGRFSSALAAAAYWESEECLQILLNAGAEVNMRLEGRFGSALATAAYKGSAKHLQILLNAGAEVNKILEEKYGTALATAAYKGSAECLKILLNAGSDVNMDLPGQFHTALDAVHAVVENEVRDLLIANGATWEYCLEGLSALFEGPEY